MMFPSERKFPPAIRLEPSGDCGQVRQAARRTVTESASHDVPI